MKITKKILCMVLIIITLTNVLISCGRTEGSYGDTPSALVSRFSTFLDNRGVTEEAEAIETICLSRDFLTLAIIMSTETFVDNRSEQQGINNFFGYHAPVLASYFAV